MKKLAKLLAIMSIALTSALIPANRSSAATVGIRINDKSFPDKVFREYVEENFDNNKDGFLSMDERNAVQMIHLENEKITSLYGIQLFPQLEILRCYSLNAIEFVNLKLNKELRSIQLNHLTQDELDLSQNTQLMLADLWWYPNSGKGQLSLAQNQELEQIYLYTTADTIDLSKNTKVTELKLYAPNIKKLDLSKNTLIENLNIEANNLASIDLRYNKKVKTLIIRDNALESLSLDNNTALTDLSLYAAKLKKLSLAKNNILDLMWVENTVVDELDLSNATELSSLTLQNTKIKNLKLNSYRLKHLNMSQNTGMQTLDLGQCQELRRVYNTGEKTESYGKVTYKTKLGELTLSNSVKVINNVVVYTTIYVADVEGAMFGLKSTKSITGGSVTGAGIYNTGDVVTIKVNADTKNAYALDTIYSAYRWYSKQYGESKPYEGFSKRDALTKSDTYQFKAKEDMAFVIVLKNLVPYDVKFGADSLYAYGGKVHAYVDKMSGYYSGYEPTVTCQWYRGTTKIAGATGLSYTIKKEDVGKKLTFEITSSSGGKKRITTGVIEKQSGLNAEVELEVKAPSREGRADGQILGVNTSMEYSTNQNFTNKKTCPNSKMTVKAGTYYIRYAETSISKAGKIAVIKVPNGPSATDVFKDLEKDAWYIDAVKYVYSHGIMNGVSGKKFEPMGQTSRAQFVTMLYNLAGSPQVTKKAGFKDVKTGEWYEQAVNWAYAAKITSGVSETKFGPNDKITRQQAAVMLYKYAAYKKMNTDTNKKALDKFSDKNQVATWAQDAFKWAVYQGVISGKLQGQKTILAPNAEITRAECAQMIKNLMEKVATKK